MNVLKQHRILLLSFAGAVLASLVFKRLFPLLLFLVGFLMVYIPGKSTLTRSLTYRFIVAIVITLCLFQIEALIFWILNIWANPTWYILISTVVCALGIWFGSKKSLPTPQPLRFGFVDIILVLPALFIGALYVAGTIAPAEKDSVTIVRSITYGMDDATHANIFSNVLEHDGNILAGDSRSKLMNKSVNSSYPMGWHISTSIAAESFAGHKHRTPIESIELYFYAKVITFMLAIISIAIFIYALTQRLWPTIHKTILLLTIAGLSIFISIILILPMFFDGFFSFLPIIAFTLLFALILITRESKRFDSFMLALLAAASSTTWMLTGPILLSIYGLMYLVERKSFKKIPLHVYAGVVVAAVALLGQAYILYSANKNSLANISTDGGIMSPNHLLLLVSLACFFAIYIRKNKEQETIAKPLLIFITVYITVMALFLLYLSTGTSQITYYYYKLQLPLLVIALALVSTYFLGLLFRAERSKAWIDQFVMFCAGLAMLCVAIPGIVGYEYVYTIINRAHSYVITSGDATILVNTSLSKPVNNNNVRTVFLLPGQPPRNILTSNIDKMSYRSNACDYKLFASAYNFDVRLLNETFKTCDDELPLVRIYTDKTGAEQLKASLSQSLFTDHKVSLVVI